MMLDMKKYDLIVIGTGSAMEIADAMIQNNPKIKIAVIDKDDPGGICLTRGCIPSKLLLYPAELVRISEKAREFGIKTSIRDIDFKSIMKRMRTIIHKNTNSLKNGLSQNENIDYHKDVGEFICPYTIKVGGEAIKSKMIFLCIGSKPKIPLVNGLEEVGYLTSDTFIHIKELPESIAIIGGGYIAAEYGHFLSAMGSKVTIIGRNSQFLKDEEPEVSALAKIDLQKHMTILTNHEVKKAERTTEGKKKLTAVDRENSNEVEIIADEIYVAVGRGSNADILHLEKGGIKTDKNGWIIVNEYLETSQPNVWALGDAIGKYQFKHVANYEAYVVYKNAVLKKRTPVDYHAVPHAIFTYPEIAGVGLGEKEAMDEYGEDNLLIGISRYQDTAKGKAMGTKNYFVKVIVDRKERNIIGAHIIGPHASVLIHEIINLMYTPSRSIRPIVEGMHIHPALSEVVDKSFQNLMLPEQYHHMLTDPYNLFIK